MALAFIIDFDVQKDRQTDGQGSIVSASNSEQQYIHIVRSATLPSACYIQVHKTVKHRK